ncbi:MAG: hypothetical protein ACE5IL_17245 [Myxococcota bacterium]
MTRAYRLFAFSILCAATLAVVPPALAAPLESGSVTFQNVSTPPFFFQATVDFQIFGPGDPNSPLPSATDFTYVYVLTNQLAAPPAGQVNVPLDRLEVGLSSAATVSVATSLSDPLGVAPSSIVTSPTKVVFHFDVTPLLPGGAPSDLLVIQSPAGPGDVNATVALSAFVNDQLIRGPSVPPVANFACFDLNKAELEIKRTKTSKDKFKVEKGVIDPNAPFDPATDVVQLSVNSGLLINTIPAGSFEQKGAKPDFRFKTGSGVTPKIRARLNLKKGEWEYKIDKTDLALFENATTLDLMLMIGDTKGTASVPLTVEEDTLEEQELEFKRSPKVRCQAPPPSDPNDDNRSCLSFIEVTHLPGTPDAEPIEKFSDEIGHPTTDFVASDGTSAMFHTSCSQCLTCGQLDPTGTFEITGISDATGKLATKCGVPDASCGVAPPPGP